MLFPDDPELRAQYAATFKAVYYRNKLQDGAEFTREALVELVDSALKAKSPEQWRLEHADRLNYGAACGFFVFRTVQAVKAGQRGAVKLALDEIEADLSSRAYRGQSKYTREKVWVRFRPVAALWGAWVALHERSLEAEIATLPMPCRADDLPTFLEIAEATRQIGEATTPQRRASPLFPRGRLVRLPADIEAALGVRVDLTATV